LAALGPASPPLASGGAGWRNNLCRGGKLKMSAFYALLLKEGKGGLIKRAIINYISNPLNPPFEGGQFAIGILFTVAVVDNFFYKAKN